MTEIRPGAAALAEAAVGAVCCVRAAGHIGWGADEQIRQTLASTADGDWSRRNIVLNLTDVTFIDSAGISALLTLHRELSAGGGRLVLCAVPPIIDQTFQVVGMSRLIPVAADAGQAREMLGA